MASKPVQWLVPIEQAASKRFGGKSAGRTSWWFKTLGASKPVAGANRAGSLQKSRADQAGPAGGSKHWGDHK